MDRSEFQILTDAGFLILDGATGTNLQRAGLPAGVCPEAWIEAHPEALLSLQRDYVQAGAQILYAPTFTASRPKLAEYGLEDRLSDLNREMVRLSREAAASASAGRRVYVAGDLTMTGQTLYPLGDLRFEELVEIYKEQAAVIADAGADLFVIETMMSLQECRAALLAVRETCALPVMITLTFQEDGRTLYGSDAETSLLVLQEMGADAVGLNCSTGPEAMAPLLEAMYRIARIPLIVKPNAGLPELREGQTVYPMTPEAFAAGCAALASAGARILGGCCGTTPAHIKALCEELSRRTPLCIGDCHPRMLCSERKSLSLSPDAPVAVIGERINPTGKKKLEEALKAGDLSLVRRFALEQETAGAAVLDVNMGTGGIDEKAVMIEAVYEVTSVVDLPLCIDTSFPEVMEAALRVYPGRALINSISAEKERMEVFLALAKKYGAMYIALPVSDEGLPTSLEEKHANLERIFAAAASMGLPKESAVADLLVATVGADSEAANRCLATQDYCFERGIPTVCGLSNISFGMPQRGLLNTAFFLLARSKGLSMVIANPQQALLRYFAASADALMNKEGAMSRLLAALPEEPLSLSTASPKNAGSDADKNPTGAGEGALESSASSGSAARDGQEAASAAYAAVLNGDKNGVTDAVSALLSEGAGPETILSEHLISAINRVGELYNDGKYFLPQLIAAANAMETGVKKLEPLLARTSDSQKGVVVIATVQGDIHDIGKNLVALMLRNVGYRVVDLGKDVPAEEIIEAAIREDADIIALSALMTTTMLRMKEVIRLAQERGLRARIIVGGAATTESFAAEIGADGYSEDAASCVRLVDALLGQC